MEINIMIKEKINKILWLVAYMGYGWEWIKDEYMILSLGDWEVLFYYLEMYFFMEYVC